MIFEPVELGGWQIPAGAALVAPQLVLHRDSRWFERPLEFHPDHWTPRFREQLPRFAYYPFGGGLRLCIGEGFAWMEASLVLAVMGQRWAIHHDPTHRVELVPRFPSVPRAAYPCSSADAAETNRPNLRSVTEDGACLITGNLECGTFSARPDIRTGIRYQKSDDR